MLETNTFSPPFLSLWAVYRRRETHRPSRRAPTPPVYPSYACRGRPVGSPYAAQAVPLYGPRPPIALRWIVISDVKKNTDPELTYLNFSKDSQKDIFLTVVLFITKIRLHTRPWTDPANKNISFVHSIWNIKIKKLKSFLPTFIIKISINYLSQTLCRGFIRPLVRLGGNVPLFLFVFGNHTLVKLISSL